MLNLYKIIKPIRTWEPFIIIIILKTWYYSCPCCTVTVKYNKMFKTEPHKTENDSNNKYETEATQVLIFFSFEIWWHQCKQAIKLKSFLEVAVKTSKRKQLKTAVYLTVKLNVIITKSSTPYKWATLLKEKKNRNTWVSTTFEDVWVSRSTWTVADRDEMFPVSITLKQNRVVGDAWGCNWQNSPTADNYSLLIPLFTEKMYKKYSWENIILYRFSFPQ